jgi:hypothetical protein
MPTMKPWETYRIRSGNRCRLEGVHHVAHVPTAKRIVEDREVRANVVSDRSILKASGTSVSWLSANTWVNGSMYGTVAFAFPWDYVIRDRKFFWVEAITSYKPMAFRILITDRDPADGVLRYDPQRDDGPLRLVDGEWFWAGDLTSEFMLEDDIPLRRSERLSFERHHHRYCNLHGSSCEALREQDPEPVTAGRLLAHALARDAHVIDKLWKPASQSELRAPLETGYDGLYDALIFGNDIGFAGALTRGASCLAAMYGALALYDAGQLADAHELLATILGEHRCKTALIAVVRAHFRDPLWTPRLGRGRQ